MWEGVGLFSASGSHRLWITSSHSLIIGICALSLPLPLSTSTGAEWSRPSQLHASLCAPVRLLCVSYIAVIHLTLVSLFSLSFHPPSPPIPSFVLFIFHPPPPPLPFSSSLPHHFLSLLSLPPPPSSSFQVVVPAIPASREPRSMALPVTTSSLCPPRRGRP